MQGTILDYRRRFFGEPTPPLSPAPQPASSDRPAFAEASLGVAAVLAAMEGMLAIAQPAPAEFPWLMSARDLLHSFAMPALLAFCGMYLGGARNAPWFDFVRSKLAPALAIVALWAAAVLALGVVRGAGWPTNSRQAFAIMAPLAPLGVALIVLPLFLVIWKLLWRMRTGAVLVFASILEILHTENGGLLWIEAMRGFAYFAAGHVLAPHLRATARFARRNVTAAGLMLCGWLAFNALMTSATLPLAFGEKISTLPFASLALGFAGVCAVTVLGEMLVWTRFASTFLLIGRRWLALYATVPLLLAGLAFAMTDLGLFREFSQAVAALLLTVLAGVTAMAIAEMREPAPQGALHARGP